MKATASNGVEIKTGDAVLVRDYKDQDWRYCHFSHIDKDDKNFPYCTSYMGSTFCIPYAGNEHLVGTRNNFVMPKKKFSYKEKQDNWIKRHDIKVGDKVKIRKKAKSEENGWETAWVDSMDKAVGKIGSITMIDNSTTGNVGIRVDVEGCGGYWYPYFVLAKVADGFEFKFGAKVKGTGAVDPHNNGRTGILINYDGDDPDYKYRVAFQTGSTSGETAWYSKIEYLD